METHDDVEHFPDLPHLLGTDLYTELFDASSSYKSDEQESQSSHQDFEPLPLPLDLDADLLPSSFVGDCQHSQLEDHSNPQTIHGLSLLQFRLHPENFQSFQAMTCPLNTDVYPGPVFNCDCGEAFNNLEAIIAHRESDVKHRPWHGIWREQGQGVCLCGRSFDDEAALRRHSKLAFASIKRLRRGVGGRYIQRLQKPIVSKQKTIVCSAAQRREQEETDELREHAKEIDMLIVEGTMRKLNEEKDGIDKGKRQAKGRISQRQRKKLERERAKNATDQLRGDKLQDEKRWMTQLRDVNAFRGLGLVRMDKRTHNLRPKADSGWANIQTGDLLHDEPVI